MKRSTLSLFFLTLGIFFAIDLVWLGTVASHFYQANLGTLMSSTPNWWAALLFYLLYTLGVLVFVVLPGLEKKETKSILVRGALFGLICYATYDLTNLATIRDWPLIITVVDLAWGTALTALVSFLSSIVARHMKM